MKKLTVNIEQLAIHHTADIYEIMQLVLKREKKLNTAKEHFWVIALNNANKILSIELVSFGSTSSTIVRPMDPWTSMVKSSISSAIFSLGGLFIAINFLMDASSSTISTVLFI